MQEDPNAKEQLSSSLINHPYANFLFERSRVVQRLPSVRHCGIGSLKTLQPGPLRLIALQVVGLGACIVCHSHVRVLLKRIDGIPAI